MKERIERPMPTTIEGCVAEVSWMRKKARKMKKYAALIGVLGVLMGLAFGISMGYQSGYHTALVDFNIIQGILY